MAVKQPKLAAKRLIRDYIITYRRRRSVVIVGVALATSLVLATLLIIGSVLPYDEPLLWIITLAMFALFVVGGSLISNHAAQPAKDLLAAIAHTSNQPVPSPLPSISSSSYRNTGFDTALQTIYESSAKTADTTQPAVQPINSLASVLERVNSSIITLNSAQAVTYASPSAPLYTKNGTLKPQLLFDSETDSLESWLEQCEENAVKAERVWRRIPDKPANEEGRRVFDVFVSYEKGAPHETVITLVDQTTFYQQDEDNLNFIAFAAHELRGPITVIRGYIDVLQDELHDSLEDDQKELFRRLAVSANRLSSYVNNILNTSRYDQRHLSMHLHEDSVAKVYETIADDMQLRAAAQNRVLSVEFPSDLPTIAADRASLSEVFSNLIDNAIKYSNEGGVVSVTAEVRGDFVEVSVQDYGIGMPSSVVGNLFQKFYRSHRSRETVAGSGIGLYISKAMIESHGGTISVRSTEGKGSTFTVALPIYASVAEKLRLSDNSNEELITQGKGWIKNHAMFRG